MTDWIEEKAVLCRTLKDDARKRLSQGRQIVDQLEIIVRRDIEKWNARFEQKIDGVSKAMPSGAFNVRKTSFPSATADAFLSADSSAIEIETTKRRTVGDGSYTVKNRINLKSAANRSIALTTQSGESISLDGVSRLLLETIIAGAPFSYYSA
jgi:hypothetical protein